MPAMTAGGPALRWLPNAISGARLAAAPILVALALLHRETAFAWLLIAALVSDIADGWLARALDVRSRSGAMLDSTADVTTTAAAACGVIAFHHEVFAAHTFAFFAVLGGWALVCVLALARYGRLSSFHTYLSKAAGYALGAFLAVLFVGGFSAPLFCVAVVLSVAGSCEELLLLWRLREWRADVRGLWWILRAEREEPAA